MILFQIGQTGNQCSMVTATGGIQVKTDSQIPVGDGKLVVTLDSDSKKAKRYVTVLDKRCNKTNKSKIYLRNR